MAKRRQRPGSGSSRTFLESRSTYQVWPDLSTVLSPIPWAVVGAVATRLYMPECVTHDLDISVRVSDAAVTYQHLRAAGFTHLNDLSIGGSSWQSPSGQTIDVIEGHEQWWDQAVVESQGWPILPLPYLILMKFRASRTIHLGDIARMLGLASDESLDAVRTVFRQYASNDLDDLESLLVLGKMERGEL